MGNWATKYSCKLMEAGIISYMDSGAGIAYLTKQTIDKITPSLIGKPVVVRHQKVTPENAEKMAVGYVTGVRFEPADAWHYVDFLITSDKVEPIEKDGCIVFKAPDGEILDGVSGAYDVLNAGEGGVWHDIKFDAEIVDGSFTHLALVVNPRYEETNKIYEANFMLVNGKVAKQMDNAKIECMECHTIFSRSNPTADTKCPKCGGYDIDLANAKADHDAMFAKEKKEHPEFSDEDIEKIVQDHMREKENSSGGIRKLAADIVEDIRADQITEQACVNWALEHDYTKAEGQEAWTIIFREMKNAKISDFGNFEADVRWQVYSDNSWEVKWSDGSSVGGTAGSQAEARAEAKKSYKDQKDNAKKEGGEIKGELEISRTDPNGDVWLKGKDGKEIGPFDGPRSPYKKNSKEESTMKNLFKIFRKVTNGKAEELENAVAEVEGKEVPVKDLVDAYEEEEKEKAENAKKNEKKMAKDEDTIEVGGKCVKVADLKNSYAAKMKKNAKEEEEKKAKEEAEKKENEKKDKEAEEAKKAEEEAKKAEEEAKNAKEEEDKKKAEEEKAAKEKENSKKGAEFFSQLDNAGKAGVVEEASRGTMSREDRVALGNQRYGSKK